MFSLVPLNFLALISSLSIATASSHHTTHLEFVKHQIQESALASLAGKRRHLVDDSDDSDEDAFNELDAWLDVLDFQGDIPLSEDEIDIWFEESLEKQMTWENENQHLDRWDERNKNKGWNYNEVQDEFSDFFSENDISNFTAEDWNDLELEFERVIKMLDKGEKSGK